MHKKILAILGPSGVGKTETRTRLLKIDQQFSIISAITTRELRTNEIDRTRVSDSEFDQALSSHDLLAVNEIYGARYGTPLSAIHREIKRCKIPLLDLPINAVSELKSMFSNEVCAVYLNPPSLEELERRLNLDNRDTSGIRFASAKNELQTLKNSGCEQFIDMFLTNKFGKMDETAKQIYEFFKKQAM